MTTAMIGKRSLENKHLSSCHYFAIIPLCLHSSMLEKYDKSRLICATLNQI